jgi:hypothetical protein
MPQTYKGMHLMPEDSSKFIQMLEQQHPRVVAFRDRQPIMSEDLNGNFLTILNHIERLENVLVKISKKEELRNSDLFFQSSLELLYGKPKKSGRYGILKNKEKEC